jgi:hypothetical protein
VTTDQKGAIAEAAVVKAAAELGVSVARPVLPERYDLLLDLGSRILRVQCKWAACMGDVLRIRCCSSRRARVGHVRRPYTADEVDAIAAYSLELDRCYYLPIDVVQRRSMVHLRLVPAGNNQRRGVLWAADFEFAATLWRATEGP